MKSVTVTSILILTVWILLVSALTTPSSGQTIIISPLDIPDVNLQGGVNHFRARQDRDSRQLADSFRRIQDGFDGVSAAVKELQNALAPGGGDDEVAGIGDVVITSILKTYERVDDNNAVVLMLEINFNSPSPTVDWDRVHVYIETPEVVDPTPLDPTGGPVIAVGSYTGLVSGANTIYVWGQPPERQEGWRVYLVSGTPNAVKPLALSTALTPSPNSLITVDPIPEGSAGEEWTSVTTSLSALVEYGVDMVGAVVFRIYGTFSAPSDSTYRGVRMVGKEVSETDWRTLSVEPYNAGTFTSTWMPVPEVAETWDVCAQPKGGSSRLNTIVPGTTDCDQVTIQDQPGLGGLDLTRLDGTTFDTSEFEISGGAFQMNEISATKIKTGTLKVGGGGDKPGQVGVFDATDTLIGWIGEQGSWYGGWLKQLWVGGTDPTTAPFYTDSSGRIYLDLDTSSYPSPVFQIEGSDWRVVLADGYLGIQDVSQALNYCDLNGVGLTCAHTTLDGATLQWSSSYGFNLALVENLTTTVRLEGDVGDGAFLGVVRSGGLTTGNVLIDGPEYHVAFDNTTLSSYTPDMSGGAIGSQSDDPYWYNGSSWVRVAYLSDAGGGSPFAEDLLPTVTATYDLGSNTYRWQDIRAVDLNLSGDFTASLTPASDLGYDVGSSSRRLRRIYVYQISNNGSPIVIEDDTAIQGDFAPYSTSTYTLGAISNTWESIHLDTAGGCATSEYSFEYIGTTEIGVCVNGSFKFITYDP